MRLNGTDREVIINERLFMPTSIAIDQREKKLYWSDDKQGIHYSIESSDLDGNNRKVLYQGINHLPNDITVSKDFIYWTDWGYKTVWRIPKNIKSGDEPEKVVDFNDNTPFAIVANYNIEDQFNGVPECEELIKLSKNKTAINDTFKEVTRNEGLYCLHGDKIEGKLTCNCTLGYTGERCEISKCHNYCAQGDCSITFEGNPICK